jgi:chromosome segregation ATPase
MKLSDLIEVFKGHDKVLFKLTGIGETEYDTIEFKDAIDTIEALQQENEQLRAKLEDWKHEVQCHMDEVVARDKEIEKLRAHVARMRELLTKAYDEIEKYKCLWKDSKPSGCDCPKPTALQDEIEQTLAEIDKAIGGKEDV